MSKNNKNKKQQNFSAPSNEQKVKMRFTEHKYYNDLNKPLYEAGKVYEIEGAGFIQRWLKRGGIIVEGNLQFPAHEVNVSTVAEPQKKEELKKEEPKNEPVIEVEEKEVLEEVIDNSDEE